LELVGKATRSVESGESTTAFAESIGLKRAVTGYVYHTVPVALHAWLTHQSDFRSAIESVIDCGGDTDTTAAIVGGIVGSSVGKPGIPVDWLNKIIEWPKTVHWIERLGEQCSNSNERLRPLEFSTLMQWLRNAVFLLIVLFHGFRRLLPPY
jgi:ADP-ribosylglycohydrolase